MPPRRAITGNGWLGSGAPPTSVCMVSPVLEPKKRKLQLGLVNGLDNGACRHIPRKSAEGHSRALADLATRSGNSCRSGGRCVGARDTPSDSDSARSALLEMTRHAGWMCGAG